MVLIGTRYHGRVMVTDSWLPILLEEVRDMSCPKQNRLWAMGTGDIDVEKGCFSVYITVSALMG